MTTETIKRVGTLLTVGSTVRGRKILAVASYPHPSDYYLFTVLAEWQGKYVVWSYNSQDAGFFWGTYFDPEEHGPVGLRAAESAAWAHFNRRVERVADNYFRQLGLRGGA